MPTVHFPDVRRPDAGTALVSQWIVSAPELQHRAADLLIAEWERQDDRPDAMLSLTAFLSEDGLRILFYAQWTDDDAHRAWARTRRPATVGRIDEELPGIQRPGLVRYALGRSHLPADAEGRKPGLLVTPAFRTDGPATQRRLAGTVLAILEEEQVPGLLGAHFHLSKDGEQVLNFAEWEDEQQWRRFAEHSAAPRLRAALESIEGVTFLNTFGNAARYRPYASLVNVEPPVR
ncbi:antibiotic biosynthesis monooxygenase [Streptomyces sp. NPDC001250]|uniref:antibiotic biosynthesis monooxygenase n=1 Tax=unclassified Streptomyces TaxID=2593676 RepID=UPI0033191DD1